MNKITNKICFLNKLRLLVLIYVLMSTSMIYAENSVDIDNYTFQYNAFPTISLSAAMTQKYHFKRSSNTALVNITVIDRNSGSLYKGIKADVSGVMQNLMSQQVKLDFKEIYEDSAYYYIAQVGVEHNDVVHLKIKASPTSSQKKYTFQFTKQFATK